MFSMWTKFSQRDFIITKILSLHPRILLCCTHTFISLTMVICMIMSLIFILVSEVDFLSDKYLNHGFAHMQYFFSLWVLGSDIICFGLYSVIDILGVYGKQSAKALKIQKILYNVASNILFSIAFPLSIVVSILFWGFYFWNRELIYPKILDQVFPSFLNHMMHTYPALLTVVYMFTDVRSEPPKKKTLAFLIIFLTVYSLFFLRIRKSSGLWLYAALEALTQTQVTWVLMSTLICSFLFYFLGYYIYSILKEIREYLGNELLKLKKLSDLKVKNL